MRKETADEAIRYELLWASRRRSYEPLLRRDTYTEYQHISTLWAYMSILTGSYDK